MPRKGCALLQGLVVCGRCGRHMGLRYSGPSGDYPVYCCTADQTIEGRPRCQEVRALQVDAEVERLMLAALAPDRIALAVAALGVLAGAVLGWKTRYEAERARRQYDAVEPENRLVARSLERGWEEKLRRIEQFEQDYRRWRDEQPVSLSEVDRAKILALATDLPQLWRATTTTAAERKQIVRLLVKEVVLDQRRERGRVWVRIVWQTGAVTEHRLRRVVSRGW